MCKSDTIVMIDSNDRTADSNSTSDFTVSLSSPLLIYDNNGLQIKSLYIPNTLETVMTGINNTLYTELDGVQATVQLNTSKTYDSSSLSVFANDLLSALNQAFPGTSGISGAADDWTRDNGAVYAWTQNGNSLNYKYTNPNSGEKYVQFSAWNQTANSCTLLRSHTSDMASPITLEWDGTSFNDIAPGSTFAFTPPSGFSFSGAYPAIGVTSSGSQISITPVQTTAVFKMFSDHELKYNDTYTVNGFDKTNLKSMNKFINNTNDITANITTSAPYNSNTIADFQTIKALYITTNVPISTQSSGGANNFLKRIMVKDGNDIFPQDKEKHYIDVMLLFVFNINII